MAYYNNASSTPCKYFQQGRCNRGNSCKFAHIYTNNSNSGNNGRTPASEEGMSEADLYKSFINPSSLSRIEKSILSGLQDAETFQMKPLSSAYSYGSPCAVNLINGRDYSPEESRWQYLQAQKSGSINVYELEMRSRENDMSKCFAHIRSHPDWAARFLQKNTKDLIETGQTSMKKDFVDFQLDLGGSGFQNNTHVVSANPFTMGKTAFGSTTAIGSEKAAGASTSGSLGAFGQPSFGMSKGAFGFGASNMAANTTPSGNLSSFGTPTFGAQMNSGNQNAASGVFGKPAFGSTPSTSAFTSTTSGNQSAIGAFGASIPNQPRMGTDSVFGKPQFGANSPQPTAPGLSNDTTKTSSFGATVFGTQNKLPFGSTSFGANTSTPASSPFGSLQNNQTSSPFAKLQNDQESSATNSPFASLQNKASSPFSGATQNSSSTPFGQQTTAIGTNPSEFGSFNQTAAFGTSSSPFGNIQSNANPQASGSNASPFGFASQTPMPTPANNSSTQNAFVKPNNSFGAFNGLNTAKSNVSVAPTQQQTFVQGLPSEEENLTPQDLDKATLEKFESATFSLGQVPDLPPPLALIVHM